MIKIAVCDDDIAFTGTTQTFLDQIAKEQHLELEVSIFLSGKSLVQEYQEINHFDLIFLDIEMNGMDGIETAKLIREKDYHVLIVYISSHEEYLRQLFEAEPFRFLKKPVGYEDFLSVFLLAQKRISAMQNNYFCFRSGKNITKILCKDILKDFQFVRIHNAYLVNIDNVESFQYERLSLTDGTILSISEKNRPRLRNEFWHYFKKGE